MKNITLVIVSLFLFAFNVSDKTVYHFKIETIDGQKTTLEQYKGKVLLVVNTASKCGLTPQYEGLEKLYNTYKDKGLVVVGFPANNFMGQEPGSNSDIQDFCQKNYGVSFPMMSKISVKGSDIHPLYAFLTDKSKNGLVDGDIKWNFQKYLIDKNGKVIAKFDPRTKPLDDEITSKIKALLK